MSLDTRVGAKKGLVVVSESTFVELAAVSDLVRYQWIDTDRLNPTNVCVTELKTPMFTTKTADSTKKNPPNRQSGIDTFFKQGKVDADGHTAIDTSTATCPSPAATYHPQEAERLIGTFYSNKQNQRVAMQWFSTFTRNYYAGHANPKPLLVTMGPTGSGKTFCVQWMITAFDVLIHSIDPLDYKQTPSSSHQRKRRSKPQTTKTQTTKTQKTKKRKKVDSDSDDDDLGVVEEKDMDTRMLEKLSVAAGQDGETLRQLLMPNPLSKPKLIHIQDVQLCRPDFLRYLIALVKVIARIPRANGIVLELNPDEAYGKQQTYDGNNASLGGFLQKQPYCQFLKFFAVKPSDSREFLITYRKKLDLKPLPRPKDDHELLSLVSVDARGDFRQLGILIEWYYLPRLFDIKPIQTKLSLGTTLSSVDDRSTVGSDIDVGFMLMGKNHFKFGYREAGDVSQQLRSFPLFQVCEFFRSWIVASLPSERHPTTSTAELVACTSDELVKVMIRGLQVSAASKARTHGTFAHYKHLRQLPAIYCSDIFGQVRRQAVRTTCLRELILSGGRKTTTPESAKPDSKKKKRPLAHISTDKQGYVEFDKNDPTSQNRHGKQTNIETNASHFKISTGRYPHSTRKSQGG